MLNRRHLRVKVLQVLYAYQQSERKDISLFEKQLLQHIDRVYENYIYLLALITEVAAYAEVDAVERAAKHRPSADDLNADQRLASNKAIIRLKNSPELIAQIKKYKVSWQKEYDQVHQIFKTLKSKEDYINYCSKEDHSYSDDLAILQFTFKKVICKSPLLEQHLEERNINWPTDEKIVEGMILKTLKMMEEESPAPVSLLSISPNWEEDKEFIIELFQKVIKNDAEYAGYIGSKTKNWDIERIALMDTLLMKMAICEMLNFPSIPVKVSINEYIDISKEYSTPNSKLFINGMLDKILIELKSSKKIKKSGRGLLE